MSSEWALEASRCLLPRPLNVESGTVDRGYLKGLQGKPHTVVMAKSRTRWLFPATRKHDLLFPSFASPLSPLALIRAVLHRDYSRRNLFLIRDALRLEKKRGGRSLSGNRAANIN